VAESTRLVDLVQQNIDAYLAARAPQLTAIAPELAPFIDYSRDFLGGGKRFRALFCYWGWQAVAADDLFDDVPDSDSFDAVILAATALEVFHAAALVHDDIMDNSDTRRGAPSAHRQFQSIHSSSGWTGPADAFGRSAALLLGDLLLGWSDDLFDRAGSLVTRSAELAGRAEFASMRTEVSAGQYLDILEENAWVAHPDSTALARAHRVIVYKSAKYTIEAPLAIGASLGGGSSEQVASLRAFGLPLGVAYQLRDDLLGVFGDPAVTGKPAGDDLREGKRTVLIALARQRLAAPIRELVDELLGDAELDDEQVSMIRSALVECGAVDEVERIIAHNVERATLALQDAPLSAGARRSLHDLAITVTRRAS